MFSINSGWEFVIYEKSFIKGDLIGAQISFKKGLIVCKYVIPRE
jgi:hypothetical protein